MHYEEADKHVHYCKTKKQTNKKIRQSHHAFEITDNVHSLLIAQNMIKKIQMWASLV